MNCPGFKMSPMDIGILPIVHLVLAVPSIVVGAVRWARLAPGQAIAQPTPTLRVGIPQNGLKISDLMHISHSPLATNAPML